MTTMVCEDYQDLVYRPYYIFEFVVCLLSSILAVPMILRVFWKYWPRVYWHRNAKILMFVNLFVSFCLSITDTYSFTRVLFRIMTTNNACDVVLPLSECSTTRWLFLVFYCYIPLGHAATVIERVYATFRLSKYEEQSSPILSIFLIFFAVIIDLALVSFIMASEIPTELSPHCLSISASNIGDRLYIVFGSHFILEITLIIVMGSLYFYNKRRESEYSVDELSGKYQVKENIAVLEQIYPLVVSCSFLIGGYDVVGLSLRLFKPHFSQTGYMTATFFIFVIPHIPLTMACIAFYALRKNVNERAKKNLLSVEKSNVKYTDGINLWEERFEMKYKNRKT